MAFPACGDIHQHCCTRSDHNRHMITLAACDTPLNMNKNFHPGDEGAADAFTAKGSKYNVLLTMALSSTMYCSTWLSFWSTFKHWL